MLGENMAQTEKLYLELASTVRGLKKELGPFAPVHIVVPTRGGSLDVTRYLAHHLSDLGGVVNVFASTAAELAQELFNNSNSVRGRHEASLTLREAAARSALVEAPGLFGKLAERQATVQAVARTSALMDMIPVSEMLQNSPAPLTREIIALHSTIRKTLSTTCYLPDEVYEVALKELQNPAVVSSLGSLIIFGEIAAEHSPEHDFVSELTPIAQVLSTASFEPETLNGSDVAVLGNPLVTTAQIVSATDADEEARAIARLVAEQLAEGTHGNRIGIFVTASEPYRALLDRHLTEAGISWTGKATRQLIDTSVARNVLAFLSSTTDQIDTRLVLNAMAERALLPQDKHFPNPTEAERLYRHIANSDQDDEPQTEEAKRQAERLTIFTDYISLLSDELLTLKHSDNWLLAANRIQHLVNTHFTPSNKGKPRFTSEDDDFETPDVWRQEIDLAIAQLGTLDGVAPAPTPAAIYEQLKASIKSRYLRHGKMGTGVLISSLNSGSMRDLDVVIVCGLAEGVAPPRIYENPLFPDAFIEQLGAPVPTSLDRVRGLHTQFLSTLDSARTRTILTYPRGNLRGGGDRVISRWISAEFASEEDIKTLEVGSFLEGILTGKPTKTHLAATPQARKLARYRTDPDALLSLPPDSDLAHALDMRRDRRRALFSRYNGNVSNVAEHVLVLDRTISPTSIEMYRKTPMSYFLKYVLRASTLNDVVQSPVLDSLTRGTLIHKALELWILDVMANRNDGDIDSLLSQAETTCAEFKEKFGTYWIEQFWLIEKNSIFEDLRDWHETNVGLLETGWIPAAAEARFPTTDVAHPVQLHGVVIELLDGSPKLSFSGQIDRFDRLPDGSIHVIDYKGGKSSSFDSIDQSNPTADGYKYQLAIYGRLAQLILSEEDSAETVKASYWFVRKDSESFVSISMNEAVLEKLQTDLTALASDVRAGVFPPIPGGLYDPYSVLLNLDDMSRLWDGISGSEELLNLTDFWASSEEEDAE